MSILDFFKPKIQTNAVVTIDSLFSVLQDWTPQQAITDIDVQSCIDLISRTVWSEWLSLSKNSKELDIVQYKDQYEYLYWLFGKFEKFVYNYVIAKQVYGECIIVPEYNIKSKIVRFSLIYGFDVYIQNGKKIYKKWSEEYSDVYHIIFKEINGKPYWPIKWVECDIIIDEQATKSIKALYRNAQRLWLFVKTKDTLSAEYQRKMMDDIGRSTSGVDNSWKALISSQVEDIKEIGVWNKEHKAHLDRDYKTEKVCALFNIPKELIWYTMTSWSEAKIKQLQANFYKNTVSTWNRSIESDINYIIRHYIKKMFYPLDLIRVRWSIVLDQEDDDRIRSDYSAWLITLNEARSMKWLWPIQWWDTLNV